MLFKNILLILFIVILKGQQIRKTQLFPKIIWVYWNTTDRPQLINFNHQKIRQECKKIGYQFKLLSDNNLKKYINIKIINRVEPKIKYGVIQNKADLIKLLVLQQHGGIFIDSSLHLVENFSWIDNLKQNPGLINLNKQDSNSPEVFMFYDPSRLQSDDYYINSQNRLMKHNPGYQTYFIAAKSNSPLITQWKQKLIQYSRFIYADIIKDYLKLDQNCLGNFGQQPYPKIKYALHYVLKSKQIQLDKQINLIDKQRINAHQFFKIWTINCLEGPCVRNKIKDQQQRSLIERFMTLGQFQKKYLKNNKIKYFYKPSNNTYEIHKSMIDNFPNIQFNQDWKNQLTCSKDQLYYSKLSIHQQIILYNKRFSLWLVPQNYSKVYFDTCKEKLATYNFKMKQHFYWIVITLIIFFVVFCSFLARKWCKQQNKNIKKFKFCLKYFINHKKNKKFSIQLMVIFQKIIVFIYPILVILLTCLAFLWDINHERNYENLFFIILLSIIGLKIYLTHHLKSQFQQINTNALQSILCFASVKTIFMLMPINAYKTIFYQFFFTFYGFWIIKMIERKQSQQFQLSWFKLHYKIVGFMKGNYLLVILFFTLLFLVPNLRYLIIIDTYLTNIFIYVAITYIFVLSFFIFIDNLIIHYKNTAKKPKKKSSIFNNSDLKQLFMNFWILYVMYLASKTTYHTINLQKIRIFFEPNLLMLFLYYAYSRSLQDKLYQKSQDKLLQSQKPQKKNTYSLMQPNSPPLTYRNKIFQIDDRKLLTSQNLTFLQIFGPFLVIFFASFMYLIQYMQVSRKANYQRSIFTWNQIKGFMMVSFFVNIICTSYVIIQEAKKFMQYSQKKQKNIRKQLEIQQK